MPKAIDMSNKRFGKILVLRRAPVKENQPIHWICKCDCGREIEMVGRNLRNNGVTQCRPCAQKQRATKHGYARRAKRSSEYICWGTMIQRCLNPKNRRYKDYGGRGITVCDRWLDFKNFIADVGPKPSPELSLDRINNDGNYEPRNVRWATSVQQRHNQRKPNYKNPIS